MPLPAIIGAGGALLGGIVGQVLGGHQQRTAQRRQWELAMQFQPRLQQQLGEQQLGLRDQGLQRLMDRGATLQEALGVSGGPGGGGGPGPVLGNAPQQRAADLGHQQAAQLAQASMERAKDRALEKYRIDTEAGLSQERNRLTAMGQTVQRSGIHVNRVLQEARIALDSFKLDHGTYGERRTYEIQSQRLAMDLEKHDQGVWKRDFILRLKAMGMGVENIRGSSIYSRGVGQGLDILDPAHWADPSKVDRLMQIAARLRAESSTKATDIVGILSLLRDGLDKLQLDEDYLLRPGAQRLGHDSDR